MFCIFSVFDTLSKKDIRVKHQIQEMNDNTSVFWTAPSLLLMLRKCIGKALSKQININILETHMDWIHVHIGAKYYEDGHKKQFSSIMKITDYRHPMKA